MAIAQVLAMTAEEMAAASRLPERVGWMACHFSPYSTGLCNLPERLPEGSLLILNDRIPIQGHDPERIVGELSMVLEKQKCAGLLLDFQNPGNSEAASLAAFLEEHITCPLAISEEYQTGSAAIFLPAVPTTIPIREYLAPFGGKPIWLETALEGQTITLTAQGAAIAPNRVRDFPIIHADEALHCHYAIREEEKSITFHTWRTEEDHRALLKEAETLGVELAVGLYQELWHV